MGKRADNSDRGVMITLEAARRINRAVQAVERGDRDMPPIKFRTAGDDGGGGGEIRLGRISSTWLKDCDISVQEIAVDGQALYPSVFFTARNILAEVPVESGHKRVICAQVGGSWVMIAAEC